MRYRLPFVLLVFFLLASLISPNLISAKGGKGQSKDAHEKGAGVAVEIDVRVFGEGQEATIRAWFSNKKNLEGLPPGLAKRERLPAGLERQLKKNGSMPPGLQKRVHFFPLDLERSLPELPKGVVRVVIGVDILLLDKTSNTILDIVREVLF
ncbi:MAG: hypothetical protein IH790_05365 [Acidobacteria bacterium]|nr:hypothetical protein [Acidobacteriota bacterium]